MTVRGRIEAGFESWGRWVVRRRWLALLLCAALTTLLVSKLPEIRVDNSDEAFLQEDDPERLLYDRFKEQFDREDRVMVVLRPPEVFDLGFFETLRAVSDAGRHNDVRTMRAMLERGFPVTAKSQHEAMPIHWAGFHGNPEMMRLVLDYDPPLDATDRDFGGSP